MDIHSIKSDLQAMEMEMNMNYLSNYHPLHVVDLEEMAKTQTPKTSHSRQLKEEYGNNIIKGQRNDSVSYSNYVSLELIKEATPSDRAQVQIQTNEDNGMKKKRSIIKLNKFYQRRFIDSSAQKFLTASKSHVNVNQVDSNTMKFPNLKDFNRCTSIFVAEESKDDYYSLMNTTVKVTIKLSNRKKYEFSQPGNVILTREEEMKQIANMMNVNTTASNRSQRWSGSLIMRGLMEKLPSRYHSQNLLQKEISIVLEPQEESDYYSIVWSPKILKSIERFYRNGVVSVFDDCSCRDLILALQFLGLVYAQNHLTFESFGTYLRFKLWRDYMTYRKDIATWVKTQLMRYHSQHRYLFVTHPETLTYASFYLDGKKCMQLDGGLQLLPLGLENSEETETVNSCTVVHDLFSGDIEDLGKKSDSRYSNQLRRDFMFFLQNELPGTTVSFYLHKITMDLPFSSTSSNHLLTRPVLIIAQFEKIPRNLRFQDLPTNKDSALFNHRLDVSSLTDHSSDTEEEEPNTNVSQITVDTMNAEWLLNVFTCKSPTF